MLTDEDIKKLTLAFPTKDEVANKQDIADVKAQLNVLTTAVDSFAKEVRDFWDEQKVVVHRLGKHEEWFALLADKVGIKLPS